MTAETRNILNRRIFVGGAASILTAAALPAAAQQAAALQQIRLNLSGSLGDFYLLYGVDNDPAHRWLRQTLKECCSRHYA